MKPGRMTAGEWEAMRALVAQFIGTIADGPPKREADEGTVSVPAAADPEADRPAKQ